MSLGRWNVDFGPVALPVGHSTEAKPGAPHEDGLESDARRLQEILSKASAPGRRKPVEQDASQTHGDDRNQPVNTPDEHELGLEIERLWVGNGNGTIREVRLRLAETLIPDTWVRIFDQHGELQVELKSSRDGTRQWLDRSSPTLAEDIGSRLQRPVRVTIQGAHGSQAVCAVFRWEGNQTI